MVPEYSRYYRALDYRHEISCAFNVDLNEVTRLTHDWRTSVPAGNFIGMSRSSTQVQRAITANGEKYMARLTGPVSRYAVNDQLKIVYQTELFKYAKRHGA